MRLVPDQWPRGELVYNFRCSNSLAHLFSTVWGRGQGWTQGRLVMSTVVPPPQPAPPPLPPPADQAGAPGGDHSAAPNQPEQAYLRTKAGTKGYSRRHH